MNTQTWLDTWLELYVIPSAVAPSTVDMYRRAVAAVPSWLGEIPLAALTPIDAQRWLVQVAGKHPRAAQLDRLMLTRSLTVARKAGLCTIVLDEDTLPKVAHAPAVAAVMTREEATAYLQAAAHMPSYPLLLLMLICGLRRGEALGLRWDDIDASGVLHIQRQRMRSRGRYQAAPLKTKQSLRALQLPADLTAILRAQPRNLSRWIVDTTPEALRRDHQAALSAAGITKHITLHGLRHTMAMLATSAGIPVKHLQIAMGHSTYKLTADLYANHPFPPSTTPALVWQGFAVV